MIDADALILEELDRLAPFEYIDPTTLTGRRRWPARQLMIVIPLLLLVLAVPAITLSADLRSLFGFRLGPDQPVLSKATLLVSAPIGHGYYAHLWQAPGSQAGRCQLVTLDRHSSASGEPLSANGGAGCTAYARIHIRARSGSQLQMMTAVLLGNGVWVTATANDPLNVDLTTPSRLPAGAPPRIPPYLVGAIFPGLHATRVELEWHGGSMQLALANNRFVGGGPQLLRPPYRTLPYTVVAYDAAGRQVASKRIADPQLYLVQGWAAFRTWKANHPHG